MEHYEKGEVMEVDDPDGPFLQLGVKLGEVVTMKVRNGSKIRNLLQFATKKMEDDRNRSIIFTGTGQAVTKTVTCVEILKREMKNLHQINKAYFRRTEEYWEPKEEGLDRLKVNKDVPALAVLLSKDPIDENELGYQAPGSFEVHRRDEARLNKRKKNEQRQQVGRGGDGQPHSARSFNQRREGEKTGQGSMAGRKRKKRGDQRRNPSDKQGSGGDRTRDGGKVEKKENREDGDGARSKKRGEQRRTPSDKQGGQEDRTRDGGKEEKKENKEDGDVDRVKNGGKEMSTENKEMR